MQPRAITREIDFFADSGGKVNLEGNILKKRTAQNSGRTAGRARNPGGRPKKDIVSEIAQRVFEENADAIYRAMLKALLKGDPEVFAVLADRAFVKCSQRGEIPGIERG